MGTTTSSTDDGARQAARADAALVEQVDLAVEGMHCASCANRIERTLSREPGVTDARVNLATERASVAYDPTAVSLEHLQARIERTGFARRARIRRTRRRG